MVSNSSENVKKKPISNNNSMLNPKENAQNQNQQPVAYQQQNANNMRPTSSKNILIFIFDAMTNQGIGNVNVLVLYKIKLYIIILINI